MSIESRSGRYGMLFGDWQIRRTLGGGSGGRTAVFELYRNSSGWDEFSALKVVSLIEERGRRESFSLDRRNEYDTAMREHKAKAEQEVRLMEQLRGKTNIVDYLDHKFVSWSDDYGFGMDLLIRMELLKDLRGELRQGRTFREEEIIRIGKDICRALVICHGKGILHRDIKPENIFFNADGDYKLGDFGISRMMGSGPAMASTGIGTPEYAAPEQSSGRYDKSVDIYSLGLVLYELSNKNRLPFASSSYTRLEEVQLRLQGKPLPKPACAGEQLSGVILKACAFRPEDRFRSAEEMLQALEQIREGNDCGTVPLRPAEYRTTLTGITQPGTTLEGIGSEQTIAAPNSSSGPMNKQTKTHRNKTIILASAAFLALLIVLSLFAAVLRLGKRPEEQAPGGEPEANQPAGTVVQPTPEPTPTPAPTPRPTEGISSVGTWIKDVKYDNEGKITCLSEQTGDEIAVWEYVYDQNGNFEYRKRNIGAVGAALVNNQYIPGTDSNYNRLDQTVENCIGFTIEYEVTRLRSGNCGGTRKVVICTDTGVWNTSAPVGTFDYNTAGERVKATFSFPDSPVNIQAFGTLRLKPDDSWFDVKQGLTDIWVADFEYVYIP